MANRAAGQLNLVTAHLEGGSSVCAVREGRSIDTAMGFTPLEGLMMGTRCGDIDPGIVPYLMRQENWSGEEIESFLNKKCGLLGVSRISSDTREIGKQLEKRDADLAFSMFSYRALKYIGAYLAATGGVEAIVLGGGIGENTTLIRERICERLAWGGAVLDRKRNGEMIDREGPITTPTLGFRVIPTQEGSMMAEEVANWSESK